MKSYVSLLLLFLLVINCFASISNSSFREMDKTTNADTLAQAKEWFKNAVTFDKEGDLKRSNEAAREALRLATIVNDNLLMGRTLNYLAINLSAEGKRAESISLSYKAFDNLMLAGDTVRAANVKINIGMDYNNDGNYQEALKIELEALELRLQCGDSTNIATYFQHIGEVYKELGIHDKWKSSLETARQLSENPKYASFSTQIGILNDLGGISQAEKRYEEAEKIYLEMYSRSKKEAYLNGMATALTNLSPVYISLKQPRKALESALESLQIHQKRDNIYGQLCAYNQLGTIYLLLGESKLAKAYFSKGLELSMEKEYVHEQKTSVDGLYTIARQNGQWKEALLFHEKLVYLKDSLQNIELQGKLADIETKYQTEKKEQQIESLNQDRELKKSRLKYQELIIWGGSLFFIIVSIIAFLGFQQKQKQQLFKQNELEQKLLRSQLNPHFIFNSLGAIQSFMMKNDGRKAAFYLSSFASLMRSILKNSREDLITLLEEKLTLENYLNLHKLRMGDQLTFEVTTDGEMDEETILLPPMLVQPFVENAILHGIKDMKENGFIAVTFSQVGEQLKITVEDNGGGIDISQKERNKDHISYALQIFKERVAILKKSLGTKIFYRIESKTVSESQISGTIVTVVLPLKRG